MSDVKTDGPIVAVPSKTLLPSAGCLFAVLLLAIVVSTGAWVGWRAYQRQAAIQYFQGLGGWVETEPASPVWLHRFAKSAFGDDRADGFNDITHLELHQTRVPDDGLKYVSGLYRLEVLTIGGPQITDAGLRYVGALANLETLTLSGTQVTDDGLKCLSGLSNLETLDFSGTKVTDDGLQYLGGLVNLETLNLSRTSVTDSGVGRVSSLCNLKWLGLDNTQVTDTGLQHLGSLTNLQRLQLQNTQVTDDAVNRLRTQLPGLFVRRGSIDGACHRSSCRAARIPTQLRSIAALSERRPHFPPANCSTRYNCVFDRRIKLCPTTVGDPMHRCGAVPSLKHLTPCSQRAVASPPQTL